MLRSAVLLAILAAAVDSAVVHYPPKSTQINNLTQVLSGSGAPGIFDSSTTPLKDYGEYNWCNMPHVRTQEYKSPAKEFTLEYVEVIQRHHKRTPYASNTFFKENIAWSCDGSGPVHSGKSASGPGKDATNIQAWAAFTDSPNPWTNSVGPGFVGSTCQFPQLTSDGLDDSITHGSDLRATYAKSLGLGDTLDPKTAQIRVTNNFLTSQVASGIVRGLFPRTTNAAVLIQSSSFDSLEPTYPCSKANSIKPGAGDPNWDAHLTNPAVKALYARLDKVSGTSNPDTGGWHVSFDHYYDNMSAKQCHSKALPCSVNETSLCVSQADANTVYRLGNWEYSYVYRDAPNSAQFSALHYGAWVLELTSHLQAKISGKSQLKYFHNIAHDGSMAPLLGFLQISEMVWPGMGSEVVFELFRKSGNNSFFLRVLWGGQPMETSTPLGRLDMIPVENFFDYVNSMLGSGSDLFNACNS
ncbi:histidine phosphatase [Infundibulicybe gibba]|nr:histidine phosphatase [Infundibulicybe gibba]